MQAGKEHLDPRLQNGPQDHATSRGEPKSNENQQESRDITTKFVLEYQINVLQVINEAMDLGFLNNQMISRVMVLTGMLIYGETAERSQMPNQPLLSFIKSVLDQETLIPSFKKLMLLAVMSLKIIGNLRSNLQMMMLLKLFRFYDSSPKSTAETIKNVFNVLSLSRVSPKGSKASGEAWFGSSKAQLAAPSAPPHHKNRIQPLANQGPSSQHTPIQNISNLVSDMFSTHLNPLEEALKDFEPKGAAFDQLKSMNRANADSTAYNEEVAREIGEFINNLFPLDLTLLETVFSISKRDLEVYTSKGSSGKNIGNVEYIGGQTDILKLDQQIRLTVLEVVTGFYNQRHVILKNLMNVEVIYGEEERRIYRVLTDTKSENSLSIDNLSNHINILIAMEPRMSSFAREGKQSKLYLEYHSKLDKVINLLDSLINDMKMKFSTKLNFKKTQNLLKNKGYQDQLFRLFQLQFHPELHLVLFTKITEFFFHFSNYNSHNKKLLLPNISIFIELISKGVDTSGLVSNICQIVDDSKTNSKIVDYIFNKINQIISADKVRLILNLRNSRKNKKYTIDEATVAQLGHLVSFKNILSGMIYDDHNFRREETQRKVIFCLINSKELVKIYEFKYFNEIKALITKEKAKDEHHRRFYSFYAAYLSLLAELSWEFRMGIDQARRLVTKEQIMEILSSDSTPLYFKKHFLKCFHHIFLPKEKEHSGWMRDKKLIEDINNLIICKDLAIFQYYIDYLVPKESRQTKEEGVEHAMNNPNKLPELKKKIIYTQNTEEVLISDGSEYWDYLISKQSIDGNKYGLLYLIHYILKGFISGDIINENNEFANVRMNIKQMLEDLNKELDKQEKDNPKLDLSDLRMMLCECLDLLPYEPVTKVGITFNVSGKPHSKDPLSIHTEDIGAGGAGDNISKPKDVQPPLRSQQLATIGAEEIHDKCAANASVHIRKYLIHRRIGFEDLFNLLVLTGSTDYLKNAKDILGIHEEDKTMEVLVAFEVRRVRGDTTQADYDSLMRETSTIIDFARMLIHLEDTKLLVYQTTNKQNYFPNKLKEKVDEKYKPNKLIGTVFKNSDSLKAPFQRYITDYADRYLSHGEYDSELDFWVEKVKQRATDHQSDDEPLAFLRSLQKIFVQFDDRLFLLRTLKLTLKKVCPENIESLDTNDKDAEIFKYHWVQNVFNNAEVPILCLSVINERSDPVIVDEACHVLCYLLKLGNSKVQASVFTTLEDNLFTQTFFTYIKDRLDNALDLIKDEMASPLNERSILEMEPKLLVQRFRDITHQSMVINILQVLKYFCDNCFLKFQNFLRNQITPKLKFNLHTINMLECISDFLVRLVKEDPALIFGHFSELVEVILNVLTEFVLGPCEPNQQIMIENKKLLDVVNTVLEVRLNEEVHSQDNKGITVPAKIKILHQTAIVSALITLVLGVPGDRKREASTLECAP